MAFTHHKELKEYMLTHMKHDENPSMTSFNTIFDDLNWGVLFESDAFFLNYTFFLEVCLHSGDQASHKELKGHVESRIKTL